MMSEAALLIEEDDPVLDSDFGNEMVRQMRAIDAYGTYDDWSVNKILDPFVKTKERKREIPVIGDPDEITLSRVKAFYNAIAAMIEKECGLMAVPMISVATVANAAPRTKEVTPPTFRRKKRRSTHSRP